MLEPNGELYEFDKFRLDLREHLLWRHGVEIPLPARAFGIFEQDPVAAGRELGVEAVLDGSINSTGERLRVSAQLFRISDGRQLWAEQFDERLADVCAMQDSISDRLALAKPAAVYGLCGLDQLAGIYRDYF